MPFPISFPEPFGEAGPAGPAGDMSYPVTWPAYFGPGPGGPPPVEPPGEPGEPGLTVLASKLKRASKEIDDIRAHHRALKMAKPKVYMYKNDRDGSPGLVPQGRINFRELTKYTFPDVKNVSSAGMFELRADHWISKWIMTVPNDPLECKNIIIRVDMYGGEWRWTGMLHHWNVESRDGADYLTATFNDDKQFLQFMLCPPNPLLPIPLFQFPRDWMVFGPSVSSISAGILLINILRLEGHLWTLPDDPSDIRQWDDLLDWSGWQVHVEVPPFFEDSSIWTFMGSRMNTIDSVIADALDDGQLCLDYRRVFTDEGERADGLLIPSEQVANGALTLRVTDRSGFNKESGTFFGGNVVTGLVRSVVERLVGDIEDTFSFITDDETLYADEYYQSGFMASIAGGPPHTIRDSRFNDLQSKLSHAPATAVSVIIGGDNPTADAIANLVIQMVGNLLGYFLLAGFDSLGDIAADIIMPFLVGTILAWNEWKNTSRATNLGWCHLHEIYQAGAEMNNWSFAAIAVHRGGFKATDDETSNTCVIGSNTWLIPGLMCKTGDRLGHTNGAYRRQTGSQIVFVSQIEEQTLQGGAEGEFEFLMKVGQNKATMSVGERSARLFKNMMARITDFGVHIVQ